MRPPKEFVGNRFHWVKTKQHPSGEPMEWIEWRETWMRIRSSVEVSMPQAEAMGWVWLGVAEPPQNGWESRG